MTDIAVGNTDAQLTAKTIVIAENDQTITGNQTFSRGGSAPFAVNAGAAVVANLDADKLDGQDWTSPTIASPIITTPTITSPAINTKISSTKLLNSIVDGRLTLTSGTPVTSADVTGAVSIFFTPYKGDCIALYDGTTNWSVISFVETTLAVGTLTNDLPYDVFAYNNSGTLALEALAWSSKTARATALVLQDGVLSKTGALTRRYLGTFHTTATTTTEDSFAKRLLWNYYNRVRRPVRVTEATDTWAYTLAAFRQANGSTANQVAVVIGVAESALSLEVKARARSNGAAAVQATVAIGEDSTTTAATGCLSDSTNIGHVANFVLPTSSRLDKIPAIGYHFYAWLEYSSAVNTTTWAGDDGLPGVTQTGLSGTIEG